MVGFFPARIEEEEMDTYVKDIHRSLNMGVILMPTVKIRLCLKH